MHSASKMETHRVPKMEPIMAHNASKVETHNAPKVETHSAPIRRVPIDALNFLCEGKKLVHPHVRVVPHHLLNI